MVATTDVHGRIGSLPWLSGHLKNLRDVRRAHGGDVLLVDAGDMWQGTLESNLGEGAAMVRAYNAIGYHAAAIGNHEFDFGPAGAQTVPRKPGDNPTGNIEVRARQARFPLLAANIVRRDGRPWTPPNVMPSTMITMAGVRIGLVGVTTAGTRQSTDPRNLVDLEILPLRDAIEREATQLRQAGATVIIVLAHAGGGCTSFADAEDLSACRTQGEIFQVARALPPGLVDMIAAGHAHDGIAHRVNGIPVVEAYERGRGFSRVDLAIGPDGRVTHATIHQPRPLCDGVTWEDVRPWDPAACAPLAYEGRPVMYDARMEAAVRKDLRAAQRAREEPLGVTTERAYLHSTRDESPASHLVVDLLKASYPDADLAFYNATGTRASLPPGPITYGALYALLPFDSVVATARLRAGAIGEAIVRAVTRGPIPIISGVEVDVTCVAGAPHAAILRNGRPVPDDTVLTMVTSEFIAAGGAGYFPDMERQFTLRLDTPMRQSIVAALRAIAKDPDPDALTRVDRDSKRIRVPGNTYPVRCTP